jgi:predicted transcriptional regulator
MTLDIAEPDLSLETQAFVGRSVALLGITGSGKTNTAAVLIEELLSQGLPMTIVDIEGEYWGLKQSYDLLIAGRSEHAELEIGPDNAAQLAKISVQRGISVILDLSDYTQDEQYDFLVAYFQSLWDVAGKERKPYQIILEEAHEWVPQGTRTPLKQLLTRIALRGRKRGLGIILMSQRSAKVEKDVLTQVPLLFLHKVVHPIDLKVYKELIPLPGTQVEAMVGALQQGQAIVVFNQHVTAAHIRLRYTFHAGATPTLGTTVEPELRRIDEKMLRELQALLTSEKKTATGPDQARRIKELEAVVAAKDAEIAELQKQNAMLSKLQVSVTSPEKLEISEASVKRMHMAGNPLTAPTEERSVATPFKTPPKTIEAPPLNERKFSSLVKRIAPLPKLQRELFKLLTEKNRLMNVQEIAAWLNVEESTVNKNPPSVLMRLRLVERERHDDGFHYRSVLHDYLQVEFPGVDVETLVQRLF